MKTTQWEKNIYILINWNNCETGFTGELKHDDQKDFNDAGKKVHRQCTDSKRMHY